MNPSTSLQSRGQSLGDKPDLAFNFLVSVTMSTPNHEEINPSGPEPSLSGN